MPRTRSLKWSELKIGIMAVVAILIAATLILTLSGTAGFWWQRYPLKTRFSQVGGLKSGAVVRLNGKEVGQCDEWQDGAEADVTKLLREKGNELVAEVWNDDGPSGFVLKLAMVADKGEMKYVVSDESWTASEKQDGKGVVGVCQDPIAPDELQAQRRRGRIGGSKAIRGPL